MNTTKRFTKRQKVRVISGDAKAVMGVVSWVGPKNVTVYFDGHDEAFDRTTGLSPKTNSHIEPFEESEKS